MGSSENANGNYLAPHFALLGVQVFFGSLPVIAKVVLNVIPSAALVGFRVGLTAVALFTFQRLRGGDLHLRERGDYWRLAVLSLFGVTLNQLLFIGGLSLTKASNTSLLAVTIPIFTLLVSAMLRTEKLRAAKVLGILLAASGVVFLLDPRNADFSSETTTGDVLIILNSLSYGIYVATSKDVITRNGAMRSITWIFIFSGILCVPLGAFSLSNIDISIVGPSIWFLVLYISLVATAVPYFLNAWALARVNPSTVAVYVYLQPLIGFVLAVAFLGEKIDIKFVVAAMLIFAGVLLATRITARAPAGDVQSRLDLSEP